MGQTGMSSGLLLELYTGTTEDLDTNEIGSGAAIFISNQSQLPNEFQEKLLPNSFKSNIIIKRFIHQRLGQPYSECADFNKNKFDSDMFRLTEKAGYSYSQKTCLNLCYQSICFDKCGCYDPEIISLDKMKICQSLDEFMCSFKVSKNFLGNFSFFLII